MNNLEATLYKTGAAIFEELVFMFPTEELEDEQRDAERRAAARVDFHGVVSGSLVVVACGEVLPQLAANMLGEDEEHTEQTQRDALGEVANIICGNLMPQIAGSQKIFRLDAPDVTGALVPETGGGAQPSAEVRIGLDGGRADMLLFLNR